MGPGELLTPSRSFPELHRCEARSLAACPLPDQGWGLGPSPAPYPAHMFVTEMKPRWRLRVLAGPWPAVVGRGLLLSRPEGQLGRRRACSHAWPLDPRPPPTSCLSPTAGGPGRMEGGWEAALIHGLEGPGLGPEATALQLGHGFSGQGRNRPQCKLQAEAARARGLAPGGLEHGKGQPCQDSPIGPLARPWPQRAPPCPAAPTALAGSQRKTPGAPCWVTPGQGGGTARGGPPTIWRLPSTASRRRELPLPVTFSAFANVL